MVPIVRPTAVLVEDGLILLVEQRVGQSARAWSLPGGALESGETIEACIVREMWEEAGLDVRLDRLLYVCDRIEGDCHVVHLTFAVTRVGGKLRTGTEPEPGAQPIKSARMMPFESLQDCGFGKKFCELVRDGFPERGTYQGLVTNIGL